MKTLYTKNDKDITLSIYHKIDPASLQFINIIEYRQRLKLACFMYKQIFQYLEYTNYCDNYIYAHVLLKITPEFKA